MNFAQVDCVPHFDGPLGAEEFQSDTGFRVLRRFLAAYNIAKYARVLEQARRRASPTLGVQPWLGA